MGIAQAFADLYAFLQFIASQARLKTASGPWLDAAVYDYLGSSIARAAGETDAAFRARAMRTILIARNTRSAVAGILESLTGNVPSIFEPRNTADAGGYGTRALGYGAAGGYGSYLTPFQVFVTAYRPVAASGLVASDADIYAAVHSVLPAAVVAWVQIENLNGAGNLLDVNFILNQSKLG